ncbi:cell division cycle protein 123 homolog [Cimex lectularius]|uniref:Cell division cycle protein 123 homolog n=1 Tax=Cimex lectularius TaxID=79782 RepID=A0A8I6SDM2_CIMLE|nr:cell division cycle protein 123 homolog [Cimex lectularius]
MKICEKHACSFQNWYPKFKRWTTRSEFVKVPDEVLSYLKSDLVMVPSEAVLETKKTSEVDDVTFTTWESDGEDEDEDAPPMPTFPEFSCDLKKAMDRLGGKVFVKLNWSAPYDASWIATNNSLKCSNLQDIYLLLKGSNRIARDLESFKNRDLDCVIVLRMWEDIHPGSEFRCFVSDGQLIAITQRDKSEFHKHIPQYKCNIVNDIRSFFEESLKGEFILSSYAFDVIWKVSQVKLVDLNLFSEAENDSFLFTWDELKDMQFVEGVSPEFRYIGEEVGIQPANLSRHFGLPSDLTDMPESTSRSIIEMIQNNIDLQISEMNN